MNSTAVEVSRAVPMGGRRLGQVKTGLWDELGIRRDED
jgi:hypothetical protein